MPLRRGQNAAGQPTPCERELVLQAHRRCQATRGEYSARELERGAEWERQLIGQALAARGEPAGRA